MTWWSRKQREEDLDRELRSDLELETEEQQEMGLSTQEARYAARRAFGNPTYVKEEVRGMWRWTALEQIVQDTRYAVRTLRKSAGFTMTAVAVLALAIGANTAMFSVLNTVLLRPLPYRSPEQLAMLWTEDPAQKLREARSALWDVEQWRSQSQSFAEMATFDGVSTMLTGSDGVEQ